MGGTHARRLHGVLLVVAIGLCAGLLVPILDGRLTVSHDALIWYPLYEFFFDRIRQGEFPLWDPYTLSGVPFGPAVHILGFLDPLAWISFLVTGITRSPFVGFELFHFSRWAVLLAGSYWAFRELLRSRLVSAVCVSWLALATFPASVGQNGQINSFFLIPALFFLAARAMRKPTYSWGFVGVLGIAIVVFNPSYCVFSLLSFLPALGLSSRTKGGIRIARNWLSPEKTAANLGRLALALGLTLALAAPAAVMVHELGGLSSEVIPTLRLSQKVGTMKRFMATELGYSFSSEKFSRRELRQLSTGNLIGLVLPDVWKADERVGSPAAIVSLGRREGRSFLAETGIHVGLVPLLFALVAVFMGRISVRIASLVSLSLALALSFGLSGVAAEPNAIQRGLFWALPFLRGMETVEGFSTLIQFNLVLLAGEGLIALVGKRAGSARWVVLGSCSVALLSIRMIIARGFLDAAFLGQTMDPKQNWLIDATLFSLATIAFVPALARALHRRRHAVVGALLVVSVLELWLFASRARWHFGKQERGTAEMLRAWQDRRGHDLPFRANTLSTFQQTGSANLILAYTSLFNRVRTSWLLGRYQFFALRRFYDVIVHVPPERHLLIYGSRRALSFHPLGSEIKLGPRQTIDWLAAASPRELLDRLAIQDESLPRMEPIQVPIRDLPNGSWVNLEEFGNEKERSLIGLAAEPSLLKTARPGGDWIRLDETGDARARLVDYRANSAEFEVVARGSGHFHWVDGWSRHWSATVDGRETQVLIANHGSKAVYVGDGLHRVAFRYRDPAYELALLSYLIALVGLATALAARVVRRIRATRIARRTDSHPARRPFPR